MTERSARETIKHKSGTLLTVAGLVLAACSGGTETETDDERPDIESASQDLFITQASKLWPSANPIPVCFQPSVAMWNRQPEYNAYKAQVRGWIESTYETLPKVAIDFTGWGECPNFLSFGRGDEGAGRIEISINENPPAAVSNPPNFIDLGFGTDAAWVNHEVLHTLGFSEHEHQRTDSTGSVGTWAQYTGTPITCFNEVVYHVNPDGSRGNTTCNPVYTRQNTAGIYLTVYDFWSLSNGTNYCHCRDGLSELDKLALEMSYPTVASLNNLPVQVKNGFRYGQSVIGFGNVVLQNDWFSRGALVGAFNNVGATWRTPTNAIGGVDSGAGTMVGVSGTYRADWTDFAGRNRTSEQLVVDVLPSRAAALALASMMR